VTDTDANDRVATAVAALRRDAGQLADPSRRGPVLLNRFFEEKNLDHVALPDLTRGAVASHLRSEGIPVESLGDSAGGLAGFLFAAGRVGWAFVRASDILPRRRFTAAHELGHFLLHRETMGHFRADTDETLQEADGEVADQMEREANRFAVELLMPANVCRTRAEEIRRKHGCWPRGVLVYQLASELLVSREAMRYRLQSLGVGDE
jgi:hypothetical protein